MRFPRLLPAFVFLATTLQTSAQETSLAPEEWKSFVSKVQDAMEPVERLENLSVPLLRPARPVSKWGNPTLHRSANGGYWMIYSDPDPKHPFERVIVLGSPEPIPTLSAVPDEEVAGIVNGDLGVIHKPQSGKSLRVKWKAPGGPIERTLRYFRRDSGGGADGSLDMTDSFSITVGGKTGYYVIYVETITDATEKRLKSLEVAE